MNEHFSFISTVRALAAGSWGQEHVDREAAIKALGQGGYDVASVALLEIVRRINQVVEAFANDVTEEKVERKGRPENAVAFPGIKVGDILYSCCNGLDCGVGAYTVIYRDEDSYVKIVQDYEDAAIFWATGGYFTSVKEALQHEAESDVKYYSRHVAYAQKISFVAGVERTS